MKRSKLRGCGRRSAVLWRKPGKVNLWRTQILGDCQHLLFELGKHGQCWSAGQLMLCARARVEIWCCSIHCESKKKGVRCVQGDAGLGFTKGYLWLGSLCWHWCGFLFLKEALAICTPLHCRVMELMVFVFDSVCFDCGAADGRITWSGTPGHIGWCDSLGPSVFRVSNLKIDGTPGAWWLVMCLLWFMSSFADCFVVPTVLVRTTWFLTGVAVISPTHPHLFSTGGESTGSASQLDSWCYVQGPE